MCHWSAPPSHPPSVRDGGTCSKSRSGIFGPKLGNARKICRPLAAITKSETAFSQWQNRTAQGCSYSVRGLFLAASEAAIKAGVGCDAVMESPWPTARSKLGSLGPPYSLVLEQHSS